ncbi:shikimate dehydrogenase [Nesterenkonia flava]|uniref:Shikimate dehydrogenase n=1 Tax=Nesterenkonia flava TaxID=469799 RepID=A0ABU1FR28_9MICC|nr:shikimate dehydrogenase [Nesterenkonia flava]MDR5710636.1 shikimate dehydrogenase [Nesterenkonia flava]
MSPAAAQRAAVLGSPIGHSKSPQLHTAAYRHLGLSIDYTRIEVDEESLADFIAAEAGRPGWRGWSVTMPLKSAMLGHVHEASPRVQTLGVLNTVVHRPDGTRYGENTDVDGILQALAEHAVLPVDGSTDSSMAILGAGGTAAAALAAAAELNRRRVRLYARTPQRAAAAYELARSLDLDAQVRPLSALGDDLSRETFDVVVSTLPPRAADSLAETIPAASEAAGAPVLLDVAYDPWPSVLAQTWTTRGWRVSSGLDMLLHQAVKQVEHFTAYTENPAAAQGHRERESMIQLMRAAVA